MIFARKQSDSNGFTDTNLREEKKACALAGRHSL